MPLQNRVHPSGDLKAVSDRGLFLGNRGGEIHDETSRTLHPKRRWASKQWICCVLSFKDRQRTVMGNSYTELFFMDEVTALAAGHRPCFECRRKDAVSFATAWGSDTTRTSAAQMDAILHAERLDGKSKRVHQIDWEDLPVGAIVATNNQFIAKSGDGPLIWSFEGYRLADSQLTAALQRQVNCLTPPSVLTALKRGYQPHWHPSAMQE